MAETDPDDQGDDCEQCGLCCRIFGNSITPTVMNLYSWIEQGRKDILRHFSAVKEDGTRVNCAALSPGGSRGCRSHRDEGSPDRGVSHGLPVFAEGTKRKVSLRYPPGEA